MRKRVGGVGAIQKHQLAQARFKDKGNELAAEQLTQMTKQMEVFRMKLQEFATKYKKDIRKNPEFRKQFQDMCSSVGVDPLASSKGFWADMLGVGDFYYQLGIQIIEVCLATRYKTGGIMTLDELRLKVISSRGRKEEDITIDDLQRAIEKLKVLGEGFRLIPTERRYIVQSVPAELSMDHTNIIQQAEGTGCISESILREKLNWASDRIQKALNDLVKEGLVWVDDQGSNERLYWFPGLLKSIETTE